MYLHHCQSQPQSFLFNNLFLWRNDGEFWYWYIHYCTWKFVSSVYNWPGTGVRLISFNADRASVDVIIYRPGRRSYDMWPRKRKFLKVVRCPSDYQIRRWCANRWNRTMSVLFVTIALAKYILYSEKWALGKIFDFETSFCIVVKIPACKIYIGREQCRFR